MAQSQTAIRTILFSLTGNISLTIIKGTAGVLGHSQALIADAVESAADVFSSIIVLLGFKYAHKPADENHPYGHGKIEPVITFAVVGFLVVSAIFIARESIFNILTPHELPSAWTLIVLGAIIIWKEISYQLVIRKSRELNSTSLKAEAWHHRSDAITSIMAFAGICIAVIFGKGYESADDWAALLASFVILYNSYHIFRPALSEIMDEHVYDDLQEEIRTKALEVDGILGTEKCYIRKAGMLYFVDLHARVNGEITVRKGHTLAHELQDHLINTIPAISQVFIHIEPAPISASRGE